MHELSLCGAIADTATEHARGQPITRIQLRIGHFRQIVPDTLQFCWTRRVEGTPLEGCQLAVDYVPAVIECTACHHTTELDQAVFRCGSCDSVEVALISGEEFLIESIDIAPSEKPTAPVTGDPVTEVP